MTKTYCDFCKKQINRNDGPIYVGAVHMMNGGCYCKACFFDEKKFTSIKDRLLKEIQKEVRFYASRY